MKSGTFRKTAVAVACSLVAAVAMAQTVPDETAPPASGLNLPDDPQFLAKEDPNVRTATAIVNGAVITGTDVDQRLALIISANGGNVPAEELPRLRAQVLRNLIDETLEMQAAETNDIKITQQEVDEYYARYAASLKQTPEELAKYLRSIGSSADSIKRQIRGEMAWSRLQRRLIEPFVNVSDEEVQGIIDRLKASKGTEEFHVGEIFLSATPDTEAAVQANAERILQQLRNGASFAAYARQFSEASTAAVGGDLGWVRAEQLPDPLADAVRSMSRGQITGPIPVAGGFSIIALVDSRKILTTDPRDAVLSLKQISVTFPPGTTEEQATPKVQELIKLRDTMGGCGGAEAAAAKIGAEVVSNDQVSARDLPVALQDMLLKMSVGQSTTPFGSVKDRVSILVLCGRDDPEVNAGPSFDKIYEQLNQERVNRRAQRYLRDLRRDAVIDYR